MSLIVQFASLGMHPPISLNKSKSYTPSSLKEPSTEMTSATGRVGRDWWSRPVNSVITSAANPEIAGSERAAGPAVDNPRRAAVDNFAETSRMFSESVFNVVRRTGGGNVSPNCSRRVTTCHVFSAGTWGENGEHIRAG